MDVTTQIRRTHNLYGGSDSTNPRYASAQRTMQYTQGNNINSPIVLPDVHAVPFRYDFKDTIGLPGKENKFYKVNLDLEIVNGCYEEPLWECVNVIEQDYDRLMPGGQWWDAAKWNYGKDLLEEYADYNPARINMELPDYSDPKASIHVMKRDTGNQYVDKWVDVRLYRNSREEHNFDYGFTGIKSSLIFAIHARNTKELPYEISLVIGKQFLPGKLVEAAHRL